jgi:DNA-binding ferritin-like protein
MNELASLLLHSQTQTHIFHLRVTGPGSYAAHKALQKYYEGIDELVDGLVEMYQGKYGLVEFGTISKIDNNTSLPNIIDYISKLADAVMVLRQVDTLQDSFIQNEIDNVMSLLYSTKYKLVNLQ